MEFKARRGPVGAEMRAAYLVWRDDSLERESEIRAALRPPSRETTQEVWGRLAPFLAGALAEKKWLSPDLVGGSEGVVRLWGEQAFVIGLDRCVQSGRGFRSLTFNRFVETLAGRLSINYHKSPVTIIQQMAEDNARAIHREFVLMGILLDKLWSFLVKWSLGKNGRNPLFWIKRYPMGTNAVYVREGVGELAHFERILAADTAYRRVPPPGKRLFQLGDPTPARREKISWAAGFQVNAIENGPAAQRVLKAQEGVVLLFDAEAFRKDYKEITERLAEQEQLIRSTYKMDPTISDVETWYPAKAEDYKKAEGKAKLRMFRVRADRIDRKRKSPRARELYCRAIGEGLLSGDYRTISVANVKSVVEEKVAQEEKKKGKTRKQLKTKEEKENENHDRWQRAAKDYAKWREEEEEHRDYPSENNMWNIARAARARNEWRWKLRRELGVYDRFREHVVQYSRAHTEVEEWNMPLLMIRSRVYRIINRRFQAQHFWPTYVASKRRFHDDEAYTLFRKRWFKGNDPDVPTKPIELVEIDISSSQTQILAAFLGIEKLEALSMGTPAKPFKEHLAAEAWRLSTEGKLHFNTKYVKPPYTGSDDKRLIDLVKVTWMRVLYGSTPVIINGEIEKDPAKFGPGWSEKAAFTFLNEIPGYSEISQFFRLCKGYVDLWGNLEPARGMELVDPFDGARVRWEPIYCRSEPIPAGDHKLMVGRPYRCEKVSGIPVIFPVAKGEELPVYRAELRRMIGPCLVHMLDASFSALVMSTLKERKVHDFVGIHDAWLVPERVKCLPRSGSGRREIRKGEEVLREVIEDVAPEWYLRLDCVYRALQQWDPREEYGDFLTQIAERYQERRAAGHVPRFHAT